MYATQNKRQSFATEKRKTKGIIQKFGSVGSVGQTPQRPCPNSARNPKHRSESGFANGFLKHTFLPKVGNFSDFKGIDTQKMQQDLQKSWQQMAEFYQFQPFDMNLYEFPYNMALALAQAENQLSQSETIFCQIKVMKNTENTAFFSVQENFCTHQTLFYVPILPIYKLLKNKEKNNQKIASLLLSIVGYLRNHCRIPYYTHDNYFLSYTYEYFNEFALFEDWENEEERKQFAVYLRESESVGDIFYQQMKNVFKVEFLKIQIENFSPCNDLEEKCLELANDFYKLSQDFPTANLYTHSHRTEATEEGIFEIEKYVSFVYETQSDFFEEHIMPVIHGEYAQCCEIEEPTIYNHFDGTSPLLRFDFESRFYPLLHRFIHLLNSF